MDVSYMLKIVPDFISVLPLTVTVIVCSGILSFFFSIAVTCMRIKRSKLLTPLLELYISFTRSTPLLVQLLLIYYGLPVALSLVGININEWSKTIFAIVTLVFHNGAFLSEILRPAYLAVDHGQHEAADSLGFTSFQKLTRIIFPQVVPIALPNLGNALINLIHDTSILFIIGLIDIMGQAQTIISNDYGSKQLEVFVTVALMYWGVSLLANQMIKLFEKKSANYHLENGIKG